MNTTQKILLVFSLVFLLASCQGQPPDHANIPDHAKGRTPPGQVEKQPQQEEVEPLKLTFLSVGQADALLIQKGDLDVLVDAGRSYSPNLEGAMSTITGPLEYLVITHPHLDHYGGAPSILQNYTVENVISNGERRGPPRDAEGSGVKWFEFENAVTSAGLEIESWVQGQQIELTPHLTLDVLLSGGDFPNTSRGTHINDDSLVLMLSYQDRRILLTGDLETGGGQLLVSSYCEGEDKCQALEADVMKVPHHGSSHFYPELFQKVGANYAVISADYNNAYGNNCLPRLETIQALDQAGSKIMSTNQGGGFDLELRITPEEKGKGTELNWNVEDPSVFAWDTETDEDGFQCLGMTCKYERDELGCQPYPLEISEREED